MPSIPVKNHIHGRKLRPRNAFFSSLLSESIFSIVTDLPGVVEVTGLRLRSTGAESFGEITIVVSRTLPLDRVNTIKDHVVEVVRSVCPQMTLTVTTDPRALDSETVLERILLTAAKRRLPVHHVTIQDIGERMSIGADIEVDGRMSLSAAHNLASRFEAAIRDELGAEIEVETHIEPLEVAHLAGHDASPSVVSEIGNLISSIAASPNLSSTLFDLHDVRVRETSSGLVVTYHCRAEPSNDVQNVHDGVDALERKLRNKRPEIIRVIGHAEPLRVLRCAIYCCTCTTRITLLAALLRLRLMQTPEAAHDKVFDLNGTPERRAYNRSYRG
jgi:divalent metal cation (Fe/Co/Zn/Cd) transporter